MHEQKKEIRVFYKNWRGESAWRTVIPQEIFFGETSYHPHPQWLLKVFDVEKNAERIYALSDIKQWEFPY
jgi:hypothetical protein